MAVSNTLKSTIHIKVGRLIGLLLIMVVTPFLHPSLARHSPESVEGRRRQSIGLQSVAPDVPLYNVFPKYVNVKNVPYHGGGWGLESSGHPPSGFLYDGSQQRVH